MDFSWWVMYNEQCGDGEIDVDGFVRSKYRKVEFDETILMVQHAW